MILDDEDIEIKLLLTAIKLKYDYDFTAYANASITRRVKKGMKEAGEETISSLIPRIIHDKSFFDCFIKNLTVHVTEMFRDPLFYKNLREEITSYLKTYPYLKIWSAGVSTGEEVYSLAILLKESGLYERSVIYATDFSDDALRAAEKGIYTLENIQKSTLNYQESGGTGSFGEYFTADNDNAIIDRNLKKNIVFAKHNLVSDGVFGEMNLILCRNVLIYFNQDLQNRVLELLTDSLTNHGYLCLGTKETLELSTVKKFYITKSIKQKVFQKKKSGREMEGHLNAGI